MSILFDFQIFQRRTAASLDIPDLRNRVTAQDTEITALKAQVEDAQKALGNEWQEPPGCGAVTIGAQIHRLKDEFAALKSDNEKWHKLNDDQRISDAAFYSKYITARDAEVARLQAEIDKATSLIAQHFTGPYRGLEDYVRNLLQAFISTKENYITLKQEYERRGLDLD